MQHNKHRILILNQINLKKGLQIRKKGPEMDLSPNRGLIFIPPLVKEQR